MHISHFLVLGITLAGCHKASGDKPTTTDKAATVELFGNQPRPPGELAKVKPGMTQADVKALFPSARPTPNHLGSPSLTIDSGYANVGYRIGFYSDQDAVAAVTVEVPTDLAAKLDTAWGPSHEGSMGGRAWTNDEAGYEVRTMAMRSKTMVDFTLSIPLDAAFFGSQPGLIGDLKKIQFGMTRDQVKQAVPGLEGPPAGGGSYIPYKAGPRDVTLSVSYGDDKVERMEMTMPLLAVPRLINAWGLPQSGKARGTGEAMHCWDTADKSMRIEMPAAGSPAQLTFVPPGRGFCEVTP